MILECKEKHKKSKHKRGKVKNCSPKQWAKMPQICAGKRKSKRSKRRYRK